MPTVLGCLLHGGCGQEPGSHFVKETMDSSCRQDCQILGVELPTEFKFWVLSKAVPPKPESSLNSLCVVLLPIFPPPKSPINIFPQQTACFKRSSNTMHLLNYPFLVLYELTSLLSGADIIPGKSKKGYFNQKMEDLLAVFFEVLKVA